MPERPQATTAPSRTSGPWPASAAGDGDGARSLAEDLRSRSDDDLAELLVTRPDLAHPVPSDLRALAQRAASRSSVLRALDRLDLPTVRVVELMAALPDPTTATDLSRALGRDASHEVDALRRRALVWSSDAGSDPERDLHLVRAVRDVFGRYPAGLGPGLAELLARRPDRVVQLLAEDLGLHPAPGAAASTVAEHLSRTQEVRRLLAGAPAKVHSLLAHLVWGPPVGKVGQAERSVRVATASSPVDWLLARGLLAPQDAEHVVLPRDVALVLRDGRAFADLSVVPAPLSTTDHPARRVDGTAAAAAGEAVRLVAELLEGWGVAPPPVLRAGGLGVRELRRTALRLGLDDTTAALVIEIGYAAGLLADDGRSDPTWAPTPAYDLWTEADPAQRWTELAAAWLVTTRAPALVGTRDERGNAHSALAPDLDRPALPAVRRAVLAELDALPPTTSAEPSSLVERLRWQYPRRASLLQAQMVDWSLREAAWLGITGAGALTVAGRRVLARDAAAAAETMRRMLPQPVAEILLQADLTAVAPGPLQTDVARELAAMADVESSGAATVYRFSAATLRRALDAGRTADDLLAWLARHSRTPVPQPLAYLVGDVARRYGRVRVGRAEAYLRADDPAVLAEVLADKRCAPLRLRRLAPTVLAAQAPPETVLAVLRDVGLAPAAENPEGALLLQPVQRHRTPPRHPPRPVTVDPPQPDAALSAAVVHALRAGDADSAQRVAQALAGAPELTASDPAMSQAALRAAASERRQVWVGYADTEGRVAKLRIQPLTVSGGRVEALDVATGNVTMLSVRRVVGVAEAEPPS